MNTPKVVAIIQARMGSSRLPGKVLKDIAGKPMLVWVVERSRQARSVDQVVVATTTDPSDDAIERLCEDHRIPVYRGNQFDVLDRYYQAAVHFQAEVIVRLTADCPLMDPVEIDHVLNEFNQEGVDFAANRLPPPWKRTYPIGLDIEVCSFSVLERAWKEATLPYEREHVMPYLYDEPGRFKIKVVDHDYDYGDLRWTVDTPEDLDLLRQIFALLKDRERFSWHDVLAVVEKHPDLNLINRSVNAKSVGEVDHRYGAKPGSGEKSL